MAKVRYARYEDIPALVRLGRAMHAESPRYRDCNFDERKIENEARFAIEGGGLLGEPRVLFVAEHNGELVGMFAGYLTHHWFGNDAIASDQVFYVAPEHRGSFAAVRLLDAFEAWAVASGAKEIGPWISTEVAPEAVARFFERKGYHLSARGFLKRI